MRTRWMRGIAVAVVTASTSVQALAGQCGFQPAFDRPDENGAATVKVFKGNPIPALGDTTPLLFITSLKVNTDGAKISYHQDDPTGRRCQRNPGAAPCAINNVRNAYRDPSKPESDFTAL